jgi:electron transport complex protein RnfC
VLKTFPTGGIHPSENKLTANKEITILPVPSSVIIPVSQHIGAPAAATVNKGDSVKTGQLIAAGKGFVSSNIHSSVSGKVNKIDTVIDSSGYRQAGKIWVRTRMGT